MDAFENSLVAGDAANALGDVDAVVAAARRGEKNFEDHLLEIKNSLLAASAELGYLLNCVSMLLIRSLVNHPCILHLHLLEIVVESVRCLVVWESVVVWGLVALHVWMSHCTIESTLYLHVPIQELKGSPSIMIIHLLGGTPFPIHVRSVVMNSGEKQSVQGGVLCARLLFLMSRRGPVAMKAPTAGNEAEVCCVGVPSSDSICHSCATWARQ